MLADLEYRDDIDNLSNTIKDISKNKPRGASEHLFWCPCLIDISCRFFQGTEPVERVERRGPGR